MHLHVGAWLRIHEAILSLPHMFSWHGALLFTYFLTTVFFPFSLIYSYLIQNLFSSQICTICVCFLLEGLECLIELPGTPMSEIHYICKASQGSNFSDQWPLMLQLHFHVYQFIGIEITNSSTSSHSGRNAILETNSYIYQMPWGLPRFYSASRS